MLDFRRLSTIMLAVGVAGLIISVIWWYNFYSKIVEATRGARKLGDAFPCLYSDTGGCGVVAGLSQLSGQTPYSPTVFWISAGVLAVGLVLKFSVKR